MGDPKRKELSFDDEAAAALSGGGDDLASEASAALASPPDPLEQLVSSPDSRSWIARAQDEDNARNNGINPIERAAEAELGTGGSAAYDELKGLAKYAAGVGHGALMGGLQHYRDDPNHSILEALVAAKDSGLASAALGATGAAVGGTGGLLEAGSDRARAAAFRAGKDDLNALGVTPREFAQRTDELGLNNRLIPMDPADKRARIQDVLADRGAQHDQTIANADAMGIGANRDWNGEVARDIEQNADRVWTGRSNQREGIVGAMGKTANAVEQGDPIDSLKELANYRTQQGGQAFGKFSTLPESASGRGALAGYDSANQHLQQSMAQSGDANYQLFTSADNDFHDAKLLEELTNQPPSSNPWRRPVGAAVGAGVGMAVGGPAGAAVGAGVADLTRGYQPDLAANMLKLGAGPMQGAGDAMQASAPAAGSMTEQLQSARNQSRGQEIPNVVENLLQQPPPWFQQYAQVLGEAKKDGTLQEKLYQLENTDQNWKRTVLPQLQQLSAAQ